MSVTKQGCTEQMVVLSEKELPLSCPTSNERVWDAHPRVYLPIEQLGEVVCPYCGVKYMLKDFKGSQVPKAPADTSGY